MRGNNSNNSAYLDTLDVERFITSAELIIPMPSPHMVEYGTKIQNYLPLLFSFDSVVHFWW